MKITKFFILFFFLNQLVGCVSSPLRTSHTPTPDWLFPDGVYKQEVSIKIDIPEKELKDTFDFNAAIKKENHQLVMLAYNNFGVTLFRIEDAPNLPLRWSSEIDLINKNKDFFLNLYPKIKKVFYLKGVQLKLQNNQYYWEEKPFKIEFSNFNLQGYPLQMSLSDEKHYWVKIKSKE